MSVLEVLRKSTEFLKKRDVESARLNAEHLLAHVLGRKRIELYLEFERVLDEPELNPMRELMRRRGEGEPLQHLLGTVDFLGQTFVIDKRAMVPRPETEELVEFVKAETGKRKPERILDVGTGSGVIAISLAKHFPDAEVLAVDISEEALTLAGENAAKIGVSDRIAFHKSDLDEAATETFDLIVANLPYIALRDRGSLSREVLRDPEVALFGGEAGDELIRKLIAQAPARLRPGGLLALEIGLNQSEGLLEVLRQKNYHDIELKRDYSSIPRFILARYG